MGRIMALLAVLLLVVNPHPLHAQGGDEADYGHFGSFCEAVETDGAPSHHGGGDRAEAHGDCIHHFDPLVRAPVEHARPEAATARPAGHLERFRQRTPTFDPPPPRPAA